MIRITSIKKENQRYALSIIKDDELYSFKISEDLLIEERFFSLRELKQEEFDSFIRKIPKDSLILDSMKYLDRKMKSEKEIREYLFDKTSSKEMINEVVEVLKKKKLIDDERYFDTIVDYLIYTKREGRYKIINSLNESGLSNYYFEYPFDALKENIEILTKKFDTKNFDLPYIKKIQKCKLYLLQKGYSESDINAFFNPYNLTKSDESKSIENDYRKLKSLYKDNNEKIKQYLIKKGYNKSVVEEVVKE